MPNLKNGDNKTKSSIKPIKKNNNEQITMGQILFSWTDWLKFIKPKYKQIMNGLINSDGWRRKLPSDNHLEDPLTVIPVMFVSNIKNIKK